MKQKGFLSYQFNDKEFEERKKDFENLSLKRAARHFNKVVR